MTLLIRLLTAGFFLGLLTIAAWYVPPFPPAFGEWIELWLSKIIKLEHWLPVRLMVNLLLVTTGVNVAVGAWKFAKWFKAWVLGDSKT